MKVLAFPLVIIKDFVTWLHRADSKESSEAGAVMFDEGEINDSWPCFCFYSFHRRVRQLYSSINPDKESCSPCAAPEIKEDMGKLTRAQVNVACDVTTVLSITAGMRGGRGDLWSHQLAIKGERKWCNSSSILRHLRHHHHVYMCTCTYICMHVSIYV